jgi:hypothetical protein
VSTSCADDEAIREAEIRLRYEYYTVHEPSGCLMERAVVADYGR